MTKFVNDEAERSKKAAKSLVRLLTESGNFESLLDDYVNNDGILDGEFLTTLDSTKVLISQLPNPSTIDQVIGLPVWFQEAIIELCVQKSYAEYLASLEDRCTDKSIQRSIKKALHLLKRKGHSFEEKSKKKKGIFSRTIQPDVKSQSLNFISLHDLKGNRIIWYATSAPLSGIVVMEVYENDVTGIFDSFFYDIGRSGQKNLLKKFKTDLGIPIIEIPESHARYLINRAISKNDQHGRPLPPRFLTRLNLFEKPHDTPTRHPIRDLILNAAIQESSKNFSASDQLHNLNEFLWFSPEEQELYMMEIKINEVLKSKVIINEQQRSEALKTTLFRIINTYFGNNRARFAARLEDMSYFLWMEDKKDYAVQVIGLADALMDENVSPADIPFFSRAFTKLIKLPEMPVKPENAKAETDSKIILP